MSSDYLQSGYDVKDYLTSTTWMDLGGSIGTERSPLLPIGYNILTTDIPASLLKHGAVVQISYFLWHCGLQDEYEFDKQLVWQGNGAKNEPCNTWIFTR